MREDKTENCLNENGYTFHYNDSYKLARINIPKAKDNPARLNRAWDEDHCLRMGMRMEKGHRFPAIVVCVLNDDEDDLATGLHRLIAADTLGIKLFSAYEVSEPDPLRRAILPLLLNTYEGRSPTRIETFRTISDLINQYPSLTGEELCLKYGEKIDAYRVWAKVEEVSERARKLGVGSALKTFSQRLKLELGRIRNDNTFVGVVDVLIFTRTMQGQNAEEFVKDIRRHAATEAVAQRMIEQRRRDFVEEEAKRKPLDVKTPTATSTKYLSAVNRLRRFKRSFSVAALQLAGIPEAKRRGALQAVRDLQSQLDEVGEALEQLCEQTERETEWRTAERKSTQTGAQDYGQDSAQS